MFYFTISFAFVFRTGNPFLEFLVMNKNYNSSYSIVNITNNKVFYYYANTIIFQDNTVQWYYSNSNGQLNDENSIYSYYVLS